MCFHLIIQEENMMLRWGEGFFFFWLPEGMTASVSKCHLAVVNWLEVAVVGFALCRDCGEGDELANPWVHESLG